MQSKSINISYLTGQQSSLSSEDVKSITYEAISEEEKTEALNFLSSCEDDSRD